MELTDSIPLKGELQITAKYLDGESKILYTKNKNLIVNSAKLAILQSLASGTANAAINTLRVGTGGTIDPAGLYVQPVTGSQTSLFAQSNTTGSIPFEVALTPTINTSIFTLTFLADIGTGSLNGSLITEAALYQGNIAAGGTPSMFSIKVHPGIKKNSNFTLHYEWVITV